MEIARTTLGIKSSRNGDGFKQGRFAASIFANDECDCGVELDGFETLHYWQTKWVRIERLHFFAQQGCAKQVAT
jgi:hypothetical protein